MEKLCVMRHLCVFLFLLLPVTNGASPDTISHLIEGQCFLVFHWFPVFTTN